jgi:hypothetical protein
MFNRMIGLSAVALLAATMVALPSPARAEIQYPWCVQYGGGRNGIGATSCAFVSFAQCMATASGLGNMCVENPAYPGAPSRPARHHKHWKQT